MKKLFLFFILYISSLTVHAQFPITMSGYPLVYTGWVHSTAATVVDSTFKITGPTDDQANHVYYDTLIHMADYCSFVAEFDFKIKQSGSTTVADGIAFWFLTNPPTSGTTGSAIGLPNYPHGLILILDTYNNDAINNNPLETLLGYSGSTLAYVEGASTGVLAPVVGSQSFIDNGSWHHVKVTYHLGAVNVYFNYSTTPSLTGTYSLAALSGYFGFSASTGAAVSTQSVKSVSIIASCVTAENNGPVCEQDDSLKLYAVGDSTLSTYLWSGPDSFTSTLQNPVIPYPAMGDSGVYMVIKNGLDTSYTDVVIKPKPAVVASSNSPVCTGADLVLSASPDSTGETFSWTGPNAFVSDIENPVIPLATQADTGVYTVVATFNGCKDTVNTSTVSVIYVVPPVAMNNTPVCQGDSVVFTATDDSADVSYHWAGPEGYLSSVQNPVITGATTANTGIYTVTASIGACSASDTTGAHVTAIPPIPFSTYNGPICSGNTLILTVNPDSAAAGASYSWTGPNSFTSIVQNPSVPSVITADSGRYTVVESVLGCISTYSFVAIVDSTPATPIVSNNGPICSGSTLALNSSTSTGSVTYLWTGPSSFTSTLQDPSITPGLALESGNYTVTVTLHATFISCSSSAITNAVINQTPDMPTVGSNSPVCEGDLLTLSSVATPGSGIYYWTGPNSFSSELEYPHIPGASLAASGVYTVYEIVNGCYSPTAYDTVQILPGPAMPLVSSNTPVCAGDTLFLFGSDDSTGAAFSWAGPLSYTSTNANAIITGVTPDASGLYLLSASLGACTATATTNVVITPLPSLTGGNNGPVCDGDTLKLSATSDATVTFTWTGPFGYGALGAHPTRYPIITEDAGIYTVTATTSATTGSCISTFFDTVIINSTPPPPWVVWPTYCQYYDAPQLQAVDAANVLWFTSAVAGEVGTSTSPIPPTDVPGVFYYYLNETVNGCPSPVDSILVTINPKPAVSVSPLTSFVCPHDSVVLTATDADPLDTYHWFPQTYLYDTLSAVTTAYPITDLTYMLVVYNRFGCTDTAYSSITVYPAGVIFTGVTDSVILYPGESYHIQPTSNCYVFNWFPPEGLSADNISDPIASPVTNTVYKVQAVTNNGCKVEDSIYFHVADETIYAVPNAFTPGNGVNSVFKLLKTGIGSLNYFRIFDRWGMQVFETNDIEKGWDGAFNGQQQPMGVYIRDTGSIIKNRQAHQDDGKYYFTEVTLI